MARGINQFDLRKRLGEIRVPVLAISGEQTGCSAPSKVGNRSRNRRIELRDDTGAGHLSNLDTPDQFNRLVLDFLATNFTIL